MRERTALCCVAVIMVIQAWAMSAHADHSGPAEGDAKPPGLMTDGIFCRESQDRDWEVRIRGEVVSLAGVYVLVQDVQGRVIFQGKIPPGVYTEESAHVIQIPRDGVTGDYRVTVLGSQADYQRIVLPYTDLPGEVYGGNTFVVTTRMPRKPWEVIAPGQLFFQMGQSTDSITITQSEKAWTLHDAQGNVVFDVEKQGRSEPHPATRRLQWIGEFRGEPGQTYLLGHTLHWFLTQPTMYLSLTPQRWFEPDARFLTLKWWTHTP